MTYAAGENAERIRARTPLSPRVGIVLGSGLGSFSDSVEEAARIPYGQLEGFPVPSVSGHAGSLILGEIAGTPVAVMSGRGHYYEHGRSGVMRDALETLKAIGVRDLILTNAAGSLSEELAPGSVMLLSDH